ncbi:hypothetical protein E4T56_gene6939 [Termitomyces sp. T112]|nr:hypothetical protein E4T56_gene6939 [Termitomyces sp. T112]
MPSTFSFTRYEIEVAARAAIDALSKHGLKACLVGSAACMMYGMTHRVPNDVDIVVLTEMGQEAIKSLIASSNSRFYLRSSINPANTFKILWYTLSYRRSCKVDILVPGILSIPKIPVEKISYRVHGVFYKDIPLAPFLVVLFLKLRAWTDHRVDHRQHMRDKVGMDEQDIDELLELGAQEYGISLVNQGKWFPKDFVQETKGRLQEYIKEQPETLGSWRSLGF